MVGRSGKGSGLNLPGRPASRRPNPPAVAAAKRPSASPSLPDATFHRRRNRASPPAGRLLVANQRSSYDWECLSVLVYEIPDDDPGNAARKIKARLRRTRLGPYDQARIDRLRSLKNQVRSELARPTDKSRYFVGCQSGWADFADYDLPRFAGDLATRYPEVAPEDITGLVRLSVFLHYIR